MSDTKQLARSLRELADSQPDELRLRDHVEGLARDEQFPGLTWLWGPLLYGRNRVVFRGLILNYFSDWSRDGRSWNRIAWAEHADSLQAWLDAARANRDSVLVRRLLQWKYASKRWGLDTNAWNAALLRDYQAAPTAAARAIVLDEYNAWFALDEDTAVSLYQHDPACGDFIAQHTPNVYWDDDKRKLWERMAAVTLAAGDEKLHFELYRRQVPIKRWQSEILELARRIESVEQLNHELTIRHPRGDFMRLDSGLIQLLEARGRDVMPYVRSKLADVFGGWHGAGAQALVKLAERKGWWDLWAATIRASRDGTLFNEAVKKLLSVEATLPESERVARLNALAGVSREWNWPGVGFASVHTLADDHAVELYRRYPQMIHGTFKPHILPTWWDDCPKLLAAAQRRGDEDLIDILAGRYVTRVQYPYTPSNQDGVMERANALGDYYQAVRDQDVAHFARRAANVLTRIPAYSIHDRPQLVNTNKLARLLFAQSFEAYLAVPSAVRDLVEGSDIHVQMLAYQILAQDDDRARRLAVETLDILIGTLLRPLHRKTRLAAFGALLSAGRADVDAARVVLGRARDSLRLPDKKYPKEELIGLIGGILHAQPSLAGPDERPRIYGLEEAVA